MEVLCIGNSFSQDASRYIHQIARADGVNLNVVNLYIGGCPLDRHYRNMLSEESAYVLQVNGVWTGFTVSLKNALLNRKWDYVSFQQVSSKAPDFGTYEPYLTELSKYVKKLSPAAKQLIHQTWAYEEGSARLCDELGYAHHEDMFSDIEAAYKKAAKEIVADGIIPSGKLFEGLVNAGVGPVHRDTFHASLGIGRYALGLMWYRYLAGNDVTGNSFCDFDEEIPESTVEKIKTCVMETDLG